MTINKTASFLDILVINQMEYSTKPNREKTFLTNLINSVNSIMVKCLTNQARRTDIDAKFRALLKISYCMNNLSDKTIISATFSNGNAFAALRRGVTMEEIVKYQKLKNSPPDIDGDFVQDIRKIAKQTHKIENENKQYSDNVRKKSESLIQEKINSIDAEAARSDHKTKFENVLKQMKITRHLEQQILKGQKEAAAEVSSSKKNSKEEKVEVNDKDTSLHNVLQEMMRNVSKTKSYSIVNFLKVDKIFLKYEMFI